MADFCALRTGTEMVLETLVFSPFNHLTWLVAREDFIIHSHHESSTSYNFICCFCVGVKPGLSHQGKNTDQVCLRTGC
jgi:hypothetical protein